MRNKQKNVSIPKDAYDALIKTLRKNDDNDSTAHRIKAHFKQGTIENHLLMKDGSERGVLLLSKKQLNHLIRLCNSVETITDYNFEIVDELEL